MQEYGRRARAAVPLPPRHTEGRYSMIKVVRLLAAGAMMAATVASVAQDVPRIGFVNTERILRESNAAKAAQQKLEQEFSRRDKELQETAGRIKQMGERLDRDVSVLSDTDRSRRQREIADQDKEFQRKQREFREDLNQRRNEELASVIERANRVIKQIAEQEKYDVILQEAVYASPRIDVTEKVLRALNGAK
jgi:outer membrane protein